MTSLDTYKLYDEIFKKEASSRRKKSRSCSLQENKHHNASGIFAPKGAGSLPVLHTELLFMCCRVLGLCWLMEAVRDNK